MVFTRSGRSSSKDYTNKDSSSSHDGHEEEAIHSPEQQNVASKKKTKTAGKSRGSQIGKEKRDKNQGEAEESSADRVEERVAMSEEKNGVDSNLQKEDKDVTVYEDPSIEKERHDNLDPTSRTGDRDFQLLLPRKHNVFPRDSRLQQKNELTKLIPGYTAPMTLDNSSLLQHTGGMEELCKRAQQTDASTAAFVVGRDGGRTAAAKQQQVSLYTNCFKTAHKKKTKEINDNDGWFGFTPTPLTETVKQDLALIRNRTYLDPKRFYKKATFNNNNVQVGTVVEGAAEFYSSRLTKKQQRSTLVDQIMADPDTAQYASNKYKRMQQERSDQGRKRVKLNNKKRQKGRKGY